LATDDPTAFPRFGTACALLDKLVTSRFCVVFVRGL
jgi:hypothetical protein